MRVIVTALTLFAGLLAATPAQAATGTTYYVDASAGNDAADGSSPATAWRSLDKASELRLGPGDRLLFRAGQRWTGRLTLKGAGAPGDPATVGSYGQGAKPLIEGGGLDGAAVTIADVHDFVVDGLQVTNSDGRAVYRTGVNLYAKDSGKLANVTLRNLDIHDVDGAGGHSVATAGLLVSIRGNRTPTWFDRLVIEDNEISKIGSYGIIMWSTWSRRNGMTSLYPVETGIPDSEVVTWTPSTGVAIRGNHVHDVTGGGITPMHTKGALVEGNKVERAVTGRTKPTGGNVGIWWQGNDDLVVQRNEVSGTGFNGPGSDGHGFDSDADNNRSIVQYNYSHHNDGGFFIAVSFAGAPTRDTVVRYNVSESDGYEVFGLSTATHGTDIHHNTVYADGRVVEVKPPLAGAGKYPLGKVVRIYNDAAGVTVRDNVFLNAAGAGFDGKNGAIYDHNLYWGTPQPPTGPDHKAIVADPRLASPGSGGLAGYRPLDGSPVFDAGVSVPAVSDLAGTPVPDAAPDLGAYQRAVPLPEVSSTFTPKGRLERLADRDPDTFWQSVPRPRFPGTVDLTYAVPRTFGRVEVSGSPDIAFDVQTSADGRAWQTRASGAKQAVTLPEEVTTRRVRLVVTGEGRFRIGEVRLSVPAAAEPYLPPGGVPVATSSFVSASALENLIDGDPGTPWASASTGVTFPGDITVDYRTPRTFSEVTLHTAWAKGQGITDVSLQTWDGDSWVTRVDHHLIDWPSSSATVETSTMRLPAPVSTQKIRLIVHKANLEWGNLALYEIVTR
ncbi:discoidin domain-containing protein [Nonomuraea sp. NPDC004702]